MGWEESQKHLLSLSYHGLQVLCKKYNLPANKSHTQLASSLALLLEKENLNSVPEMENLFGSTQASFATSSALLSSIKETFRCGQDNHKRGTYSDRDDDDRPFMHPKHKKGPQAKTDETLKSDFGIRMGFPPVSVNVGTADCFSRSSGQGIAYNVESQSVDGIATKLTPPEHATRSHEPKISFVRSYPYPGRNGMVSEPCSHTKVGESSGSSDKVPANATPTFTFFKIRDEGINLVVDLNSTTSAWVDSITRGVRIPPSTHHSEPGNFSNSISSLVSKDSDNTVSPSGNIILDTENGENSQPEPSPPETTVVNSKSSAFTLPGTLVEISGSQEGAPVVHSSCLTFDTQNNMSSDMMAGVLPQESTDVSVWSERSHAPLADDSIHPTGDVVWSDSDESSCPISAGTHLTHNGGRHEARMENEPVEAVPMEGDMGCGDRLSISCQLARQTVAKLPATDAQSDASSADHCVAGCFNLTDPTPSLAASDDAINPLTSEHGAETTQSDPASGGPARNILLSLRSASARQTKPATLPRRSARLVPK